MSQLVVSGLSVARPWRLWASQLSPSLQLHTTAPFPYMLTDVWLLGFKEAFWVTYVCFPEALLSYLLISYLLRRLRHGMAGNPTLSHS